MGGLELMAGTIQDHAEECGLSEEEFTARVEARDSEPFLSLGGSPRAWTMKLSPEQSARILRKRDPQIFYLATPRHH